MKLFDTSEILTKKAQKGNHKIRNQESGNRKQETGNRVVYDRSTDERLVPSAVSHTSHPTDPYGYDHLTVSVGRKLPTAPRIK